MSASIPQIVIDKQNEIAKNLAEIVNEVNFGENFTNSKEIWLSRKTDSTSTNKIFVGKTITKIEDFCIGKAKNINPILITAFKKHINSKRIPIGTCISVIHKQYDGNCLVDIYIFEKKSSKVTMEQILDENETGVSYEVIEKVEYSSEIKNFKSKKEVTSHSSEKMSSVCQPGQPSASSSAEFFLPESDVVVFKKEDESFLDLRRFTNHIEKLQIDLESFLKSKEKNKNNYLEVLSSLKSEYDFTMTSLDVKIENTKSEIKKSCGNFSEKYSVGNLCLFESNGSAASAKATSEEISQRNDTKKVLSKSSENTWASILKSNLKQSTENRVEEI